jgi:hypothetical protein
MMKHRVLGAMALAFATASAAMAQQSMTPDQITRHCEKAVDASVERQVAACKKKSPRANCDGYKGRRDQELARCKRDLTRNAASIRNWPTS